MRTYTKNQLQNIAYPIGGIGTGNFALAGNGKFMGPDFRGKPNNEVFFGATGFSIKAEKDGEVLDWRMLNGDCEKDPNFVIYGQFGTGWVPPTMGFRHFRDCTFTAKFPFADISLKDDEFPGKANINCYNPFIPSNEKDSSLPTGIFKITIGNTSDKKIKYTVAFILQSLDGNKGRHVFEQKNGLSYFTIFNQYGARSKKHEEMIIMTDNAEAACQHYLSRDRKLYAIISDFSTPGKIKARLYEDDAFGDAGMLTASIELDPGESGDINFYFCWYCPHFVPYWEKSKKVLGFSYGKYFRSAKHVADYCYRNRKRLKKETEDFSQSLFSSDLPEDVKNAINRNLCTLKSSTVIRLGDGSLWGWEGQMRFEGSCAGTCQHVYNYQYTIPFLFPSLERGMHSNDMRYCLEESGVLHCRLPITRDYYNGDKGVVDAVMSTVYNCYREWLISGDTEWLKGEWNNIRKIMEYTWSDDNSERWDPDKSGLITGRQFNTLDIEIFGVHSWLTLMYHLALICASKMADAVGDTVISKEYMSIYERGKDALIERTFNGEYFIQDVDINSTDALKHFIEDPENSQFWDKENRQIKYQIANGCEIDQVLACWQADIMGIEDLLDKKYRVSALNAIYKYNFKCMRKQDNPSRLFAFDDEKGTVMNSFPHGEPAVPILYSEECMTGFEYAVAENMLQCGMEEKALCLTNAINERYDGTKRNPFAEIECGANYARAMSCYGFLPIYSGFKFNLPEKELGFIPLKAGRYFWSVDGAWGTVELKYNRVRFKVIYGKLLLKSFISHLSNITEVSLSGVNLTFKHVGQKIIFDWEITIDRNRVLLIK